MSKRLHVAVVWHMHQPLYKDRLTGRYQMPWVRMHAQKDYLDMLAVLEPYPTLRQTFNLVPCLLEQIEDYAAGAWDRALELLVLPVDQLTPLDQAYILERFFDLNSATMLAPYPRYVELANKRERLGEPASAAEGFSAADWLDLTTWFNLAWFDPLWLEGDPTLRALVAKGRGFTQADRERLLAVIRATMGRVVPEYRRMAEAGRIELTTTPYYHPILPLLCDRDSALVARPHLPLPAGHFAFAEDAEAQLARGLAYFERLFGHRPRGMWPSEQSVSPEALALMARQGVGWAISDEGVLAHTLGLRFTRDAKGRPLEMRSLYQPYWVETSAGRVAMVFRDVVLSDLIGFGYAHMAPAAAAADLHRRLSEIRRVLPDGGDDHLVTIALDGENCWEHYAGDGAPFLHELYRRVEQDPGLEMVTVGEYLEAHPPRRTLPTIFSGSWINADFTTWIGEPTKNRAWDALYQTRQELAAAAPRLEGTAEWAAAWEEIHIAEGSDWFWWFGEGHDSGQDDRFDQQFRLHLQNVYRLLGLEPPARLQKPLTEPAMSLASVPHVRERPCLDGRLSDAEWRSAATFDPTTGQGAMHAAATFIRKLYLCQCDGELYLGVRLAEHLVPGPGDEVVVYLCYPGRVRHNARIPFDHDHVEGRTREYHFAHAWHLKLGPSPEAILLEAGEYGTWQALCRLDAAYGEAGLEAALPLGLLEQPPGQEARLVIAGVRAGRLVEVLPPQQTIAMTIPAMEAMTSP